MIPWITEIKKEESTPSRTPVAEQSTSASKITPKIIGLPVEDEATLSSLNHQGNKRPKDTKYYSLNVKRLKVTPNSKNKKKL